MAVELIHEKAREAYEQVRLADTAINELEALKRTKTHLELKLAFIKAAVPKDLLGALKHYFVDETLREALGGKTVSQVISDYKEAIAEVEEQIKKQLFG